MVAYFLNPSIQQTEAGGSLNLSEFMASLVFKASSRIAKAVTQRNPVFKNKQTNKQTCALKNFYNQWYN